MSFYLSRGDVALFVAEELTSLKPGSVLTMTITVEPSEDFSVSCVIGSSSEGTEKNLAAWPYLETQPNT